MPTSRLAGMTALLVVAGTATALAAPASATPAKTAAVIRHPLGAVLYKGTAKLPVAHARATLPDAADLRADAPAVGDQGQVGACVEWTVNYGLMGYWSKHLGLVGAPFQPMFLYRQIAVGSMPSAGTNPDTALAKSKATGVDTMTDYYQGSYNYTTAAAKSQLTNALRYKVSGYNVLWYGNNAGTAAQTAIESSLAAGNPVGITFNVYPDFFSYRGGLYNTTSGASQGGHMTAVYAYDAQGIWLRNSWGTGWGVNGEAHMSWNWVEHAVNAAYNMTGITAPADATTAPAPYIMSVGATKATTDGGTATLVTGTNLQNATAVTVGGTAATFSVQYSGGKVQLLVTTPAHAPGVADIRVTTPSGTSTVTAYDRVTYVPPVPAVTSVTPATGTAVGGTTVTVTGTNLGYVTWIKVGAGWVKPASTSATQLTFVTPRSSYVGNGAILIQNAGGTATSPTAFAYSLPDAPTVTSMSRAQSYLTGGVSVNVYGTGFTYASKVTVNGYAVPYTLHGDTMLTFVTPKHVAGAVDIAVTNIWKSASTSSAHSQMTYAAKPDLTKNTA